MDVWWLFRPYGPDINERVALAILPSYLAPGLLLQLATTSLYKFHVAMAVVRMVLLTGSWEARQNSRSAGSA